MSDPIQKDDVLALKPRNYKNIANKRFGFLIAKRIQEIRVMKRGDRREIWECLCDCGEIRYIFKENLLNRHTRSCNKCARIGINLIDMTGKKIGRLKVLGRASKTDSSGNAYWDCECDCGNKEIKKISRSDLITGNTTSCGCVLEEYLESKFLGETNAEFSCLLYTYRSNARKRGYSFELNEEEFRKLTKGNCYYCSREPSQRMRPKRVTNKRNRDYIYNGIDRVDNDLGYTLDNCVSCCSVCNEMKSSNTQEGFLQSIKFIYDNFFNKN